MEQKILKIDNKRKNEDDEEKGQKSATIFTIKVFTMVFTILRKFEIWGQFHQRFKCSFNARRSRKRK